MKINPIIAGSNNGGGARIVATGAGSTFGAQARSLDNAFNGLEELEKVSCKIVYRNRSTGAIGGVWNIAGANNGHFTSIQGGIASYITMELGTYLYNGADQSAAPIGDNDLVLVVL